MSTPTHKTFEDQPWILPAGKHGDGKGGEDGDQKPSKQEQDGQEPSGKRGK